MIGIIAAMEKEVELLRSRMLIPKVMIKGPFTFYQGLLEGQKVVLLKCGIGKVNAGAATALLIEIFDPKAIINTGTAGGYLDSQKTGDLVISDRVVHHDADATAFGYDYGQIPQEPRFFEASPVLISRAVASLNHLKDEGEYPSEMNFTQGLLGSGDKFMTDPEDTRRLKALFPDMSAVEMEGAGIAQICHSFHIPFVIIRAISDKADSTSTVDFGQFVEVASRHSAITVMDMLKNWRD